MAMPDLNQFWMLIYGGYGYDTGALNYLGLATGVTPAGNPPYTVSDFLAMYPKFSGVPVVLQAVMTQGISDVQVPNSAGLASGQLVMTADDSVPRGTIITTITVTAFEPLGNTTANSPLITGVSSTAGLMRGQALSGGSFPDGTTIDSFTSTTITASQDAAATAVDVELNISQVAVILSAAPTASQTAALIVYVAPLVPLIVMQLYINLATNGLMSSRWRSNWAFAMALYVAHFCTLWLQSEGNPQTTAGQVVANALQVGLLVSEAADGVSAGFKPLDAIDSWAAWGQTTYGAQLVTMARAVGAGAVYFR